MNTIEKQTLSRACNVWNRLTNPSVALTDEQHQTRRARARRIWAKHIRPGLERGEVREWSNGSVSAK